MTIEQIDAEIKRLTALKQQKEQDALHGDEYIGKFYKNTNGSIGKIAGVYSILGETRFACKSLWFDDEAFAIIVEEDTLSEREFDVITPEEFASIYKYWVETIANVFGTDVFKDTLENEESEEIEK